MSEAIIMTDVLALFVMPRVVRSTSGDRPDRPIRATRPTLPRHVNQAPV